MEKNNLITLMTTKNIFLKPPEIIRYSLTVKPNCEGNIQKRSSLLWIIFSLQRSDQQFQQAMNFSYIRIENKNDLQT